jgi:hypothetical protein
MRQEDSKLRRHGGSSLLRGTQGRKATLSGVPAPDRLPQLHLVAEQYHVLRRSCHGGGPGRTAVSLWIF